MSDDDNFKAVMEFSKSKAFKDHVEAQQNHNYTQNKESSDFSKFLPFVIFGLFMLILISSLGNCSNNSARSNDLYESATRKIDKGETLTPNEVQRMHDIIYWDESKKKYNIK